MIPPDQARVRVCMVVRNAFTHDARVKREATALAGAGYDVTVIAHKALGRPVRELLPDGIQVIRLAGPHQFGLRTAFRSVVARLHGSSQVPASSRSGAASMISEGDPDGTKQEALDGAVYVSRGAVFDSTRKGLVTIVNKAKRLIVNRRIVQVILSVHPDVIHVHDLNALYAGVIAKRKLRVPLVYDSHELSVGITFRSWLARRWASFSERRWIRHADAVITVSPSIGAFLAERYGIEPPVIVKNIPSVSNSTDPIDVRRLAGLDASARIVLYLGGAMPHRGLEELIESARFLDGCFIVLMGPATWYDKTVDALISQSQFRSRFVRLGPCLPTEVVAVASTADLGVVLTHNVSLNHYWSLPNKLFEYISAGLPVVASDLPDIAAIVRGEDIGETCDPTDPSDIARAVRRVLDDPQRLEQLRENSRIARQKYDWGVEGRKLVALYSNLPTT